MNESKEREFNITSWSDFVYGELYLDGTTAIGIFYLIYLICIFVISLSGNILICFVIYSKKSMHTANNCYIFNLAICDLLCCVVLAAVTFYYIFDIYRSANWLCTVNFFSVIFLWNYSILLMTVLAIERCLAICKPMLMKNKCDWRKAFKMVVLVWLLSFIGALPEIWTAHTLTHNNWTICYFIPTKAFRLNGLFLVCFTYIIPLVIMVVAYSMIAYKVRQMKTRQEAGRVFNYPDNRRVSMLAVMLTLSFVIFWMPMAVLRFTTSIYNSYELLEMTGWYRLWSRFASTLSWLNLVFNPLLFSIFSTKFRNALKELCATKQRNQRATTTRY